MPPLEDIDKSILNRIQSDFPINSNPYLTANRQSSIWFRLCRVGNLHHSIFLSRKSDGFTDGFN